MKCPSCHHENREEARFCLKCGTDFAVSCTSCGKRLPREARFCDACGYDLSQPATPSQTPTPETPPPAGERRQATILFSDLSGYTAMNEKLDPEEVETIMSRIKVEAVKIVEGHGGIVSQFVGDEVLALFGIPTAHEDDPRRAVRAALELHDLARNMSPEVEEKIGRPLRMHTGMDTGLVVTSSRDVRDGTVGVTGDTVNTGARLKALAGRDQILVSPDTERRIAPFFDIEPLPPEALKGQAAALTPYRIVGETQVETRFEAAQRRGLSRYVGRERELEMLWECFHQAEQGQGQVVSVVGEAGLGKTRLIYEFRTALDLSRVNQVRGRCAATGENLSYLPFVDLFQRWFRIRETDTPAQMLEKTSSIALALDPGLEEHLPALLHLLSIPGEHSFPSGMAGEAIQRKVQAALKATLLAGCRERPLVMVFEDLHWVDGSSESMLQQYIEALPAQPALLLLSYRPEYRPPWGHYGHLTPLVLKPLGEESTAAIAASALKVESLPEGLAPVVQAHTEGNPFFTEEVALSLEEEGLVRRDNGSAVLTRPVEDISFPDSVQAVVRARIDRLPEASRDTLRLAAVVGRDFTENLVARLSETEEAIPTRLGELRTLELILEKRFQPELEFMFKHAITHQVAYESLLLARRKALHKLVGLAIEELYADRLPEFYEMLAHHFDLGEVWDKAVDYLIKAGMKGRKNNALQASLEYFDRAKKIDENNKPGVPWRVRYDLFFERSQALGDAARWYEGCEELVTAREIARENDSTSMLVRAVITEANAALSSQQMERAKNLLDEVEPLVGDNPRILLGSLAMRALISGIMGEIQAADAAERKTRDALQQAPDSPYIGLAIFASSLIQRWRGNARECVDMLKELLPRAKEVAITGVYLQSLFQYGLALGEKGRLQEAIETLADGMNFGMTAGEMYATPKVINSLGWAYHELCLFDRAIHFNTLALDSIQTLLGPETTNLFEIESQTRINLGENYMAQGHFQKALDHLGSVYENIRNPAYFFVRVRWKPRCLLTLAEYWLMREDRTKAQAYLDEAMEDGVIDEFPFKKYQVRAGRLQGNIHAAQGKDKEAESELKKALKLAKELGNPTQLWRTAQALGNLYAGQGKAKQGAAQYKAALKVAQDMADGLTDPELKEGFLNAAPIREVFAQAEGG